MFLRWEGDKSTALLLFNLSFNKKYSEKKFGGDFKLGGWSYALPKKLKIFPVPKKIGLIAKENQTDVI